MRRKLLSVVLCVCMMLTMAPFAFAEEDTTVAKIGDTSYSTLDAAVSAANSSESTTTIELLKNVTIASQLTFSKPIILNGNNHTITATGESEWTGNDGKHLLLITSNGVTINNTNFNCANVAYDVHVYKATGVTFSNVTIKNSCGAALGVNASKVTVTGTLTMGGASWKDSVNVAWGSSISGVTECSFDASRATLYEIYSVYSDDTDISNAGANKITVSLPSTWTASSEHPHIYSQEIAEYNSQKYPTLQSAISAINATEGKTGTIDLLTDASNCMRIRNGENVTLNLNGHTLSYPRSTVGVLHGTLTVNGSGTIKEATPYFGAIIVMGSTSQSDENYTTVNVNKDVTLEGWAPLFIDQNSEKAYGVTVNLDGATLNGKRDSSGDLGSGIYVNGSIKDTTNAPVINLKSTTVNSEGQGMYLAGYATTTVDKDSSVVGSQTGIEIRAGKLDINGATVIGNGIPTKITPNGNGSTAEGAGIAVMQHTSKLPIDVTISDGTISGYTGLLEANPQKNSAEDIAKVNIKVTGGKFSAINGGTNSISSDDKTGFITGGLFSSDPTPYCGKTEGEDNKQLAGIENTNSATKAQYPFTVGILDLATDVDVAPAAPATKAETTGKDQNVVPVMNSAATAAAGTTATGLDAIGGNEATKVTTSEVNEAKTRLSQTEGVTVGDQTVTLYVQPYLDITVTDADVTTSSEGAASTINSLSLNIIPMVKKVASTATSVENIELNPGNETGKTKNATVISTTEVKNVNTPVTITLPLPSGFASSTTDKLSIKHTKANGSVEYYTGTVTSAATGQGEDAVTTYYVTFTTNGFSPFVIYAASANVASIGDNVYPSLQAAIDAVQDNQTITLLKDTDENVTVSKAVKFTLDTTSSNFTGSITAGSRYTLTQSGNTYTVTRQSSSSSGSTSTTYDVNVNAATNGAVAADKKTASKGTTVTVTASPSKGYVVDAVKVVDKDGKDVAVTVKDGKYVFTMPASAVTVTGSFKAETPAPAALPFTDVKSGNWFYDAVKYAYAQGLMTGTSATTFAPNGTMNRAMIVTVLYRLEKSPAVTGASKFTDVPAGQWYSDAVAWAAANKIVNGYDETTFGPMNAVTREQMAAILFRYEQVKGLENVTLEENLNRFPDQNKISAYAIPALQWAVGQKIINGNADGTLDPTGTATRAQVAQIFTNLLNK